MWRNMFILIIIIIKSYKWSIYFSQCLCKAMRFNCITGRKVNKCKLIKIIIHVIASAGALENPQWILTWDRCTLLVKHTLTTRRINRWPAKIWSKVGGGCIALEQNFTPFFQAVILDTTGLWLPILCVIQIYETV